MAASTGAAPLSRSDPGTARAHAPMVRRTTGEIRRPWIQSRGISVTRHAAAPSGGSIPFVRALAAARPIDVALLGFGLPDDAIHAPNERLYLPNLCRGTDACIELYQHLGSR